MFFRFLVITSNVCVRLLFRGFFSAASMLDAHLPFFCAVCKYLLMEKVRIPTKVLLDAMPQKLKLPYAVYSTHKARIIGLDATIEFYPSDHQLKKGLQRNRCPYMFTEKGKKLKIILQPRLSNTWRPPTAKYYKTSTMITCNWFN